MQQFNWQDLNVTPLHLYIGTFVAAFDFLVALKKNGEEYLAFLGDPCNALKTNWNGVVGDIGTICNDVYSHVSKVYIIYYIKNI